MGTASQTESSWQALSTLPPPLTSPAFLTQARNTSFSLGLKDLLIKTGRNQVTSSSLQSDQPLPCLLSDTRKETSLYLVIIKCIINSQEVTPQIQQDCLYIHLHMITGHCSASSSQAPGPQPTALSSLWQCLFGLEFSNIEIFQALY